MQSRVERLAAVCSAVLVLASPANAFVAETPTVTPARPSSPGYAPAASTMRARVWAACSWRTGES